MYREIMNWETGFGERTGGEHWVEGCIQFAADEYEPDDVHH